MFLSLFCLLSMLNAAPLRVMTHNFWHGFGLSCTGHFGALESHTERREREYDQARLLHASRADVYLLQEFNGIPRRSDRLAQRLPADAQAQLDAVGFKVLGFGYPPGLNSGTLTLTRLQLRARPLGAISLDQNLFNPMSRFLSLQTREEHFAVLSAITVGRTRVLLANVHLHGDVEGDRRRLDEVNVLLAELDARADDFDVIVVGGDFNASPDEEGPTRLVSAGFYDAWVRAHGSAPGYTYDETTNALTRKLAERVWLPEEPWLVARERRARRIDYLWIRDPRGVVRVKSAELITTDPAISDHHGVCVDLLIE